MSDYFQRLIAQTGILPVPAGRSEPVSALPLMPLAGEAQSPARDSEWGPVEVIEEVETRAPWPAAPPGKDDQPPVAANRPSGPLSVNAGQEPPRELASQRKPETEQQPDVAFPAAAAVGRAARQPSLEQGDSEADRSHDLQRKELAPSQAPETGAEILAAVFQWVAGTSGGRPTDPAPERGESAPLARAAPTEPGFTPAAEVVATPDAPARRPERRPLVRAQASEGSPAGPTGPVSVPPANQPPAPAAAAEPPPCISIGSIEVTVEAPPLPPPPAPAPMARPRRSVESPACFSAGSNLSRLRRYYVIPH
jgi:hypothetical protein